MLAHAGEPCKHHSSNVKITTRLGSTLVIVPCRCLWYFFLYFSPSFGADAAGLSQRKGLGIGIVEREIWKKKCLLKLVYNCLLKQRTRACQLGVRFFSAHPCCILQDTRRRAGNRCVDTDASRHLSPATTFFFCYLIMIR